MNTRNYFFVIKVILILYISIFSSSLIYTQDTDSLYYTNPDYHVAKELFNKKIVMLGDYAHQSANPERRVIKTLNNWLDICIEKGKNYNLSLIIEFAPDRVSALNTYIQTGDLKSYCDKATNGTSLQDLEYFGLLRKFSQKIDSFNHNSNYKLSFKIAGFEQYTDSMNFNYLLRWQEREAELWFINTRDTMLSRDIIEYSTNNPDEQILIFYGIAHLQNYLVDKLEESRVLQQNERMGHFLAYYLKRYFGESSVETFAPLNCMRSPLRFDSLKRIFKNNELELKRNEEIIFRPEELSHPVYWDTTYDYIINTNKTVDKPIYTHDIYSRYIFDKTVKRINLLRKALPGFKAVSNYQGLLQGLKFFTGIGFKSDSELTEWVSENNYDAIDWLYNDKFADNIKSMILRYENRRYINPVIRSYGIPIIPDSLYLPDEKWIKSELPKLLEQIKFTNSIGIYWFGYPDEKIKAKEYLVKFSGEDFAEPEKYLQWYRKKYFDYDY